jgi:hypothetical protein
MFSCFLPAMTSEDFEATRTLWKMEFAAQTFRAVRAGIRSALDRGITRDSAEYYPMAVGLLCLYARPFCSSKPVGTVSEGIVPKEYRALHKRAINIRHKAFAHSDAEAAITGDVKTNELRFCQDETDPGSSARVSLSNQSS